MNTLRINTLIFYRAYKEKPDDNVQ